MGEHCASVINCAGLALVMGIVMLLSDCPFKAYLVLSGPTHHFTHSNSFLLKATCLLKEGIQSNFPFVYIVLVRDLLPRCKGFGPF